MNRTLLQATGKCDIPLLEATLAGQHGHISQEDLNDALVKASLFGYGECASRLISELADPDAEDYDGNPVVTLAAQGGHVRVVRQLLLAGCDVNAMTDCGQTALHLATLEKNAPVVLLLLRNGANCNPNCQDDDDDTPLMFACKAGHPLITQLLLHAGADVNLCNNEGFTALHFAAKSGDGLCCLLLQEANADLAKVNVWKDTALLIACKEGHDNIGELLAVEGSDIHAVDRSQCTPIHYAIKNGLVDTTKALLEAGAMDLTDADSNTPLMEAVISGHLELLRMLVAANFNVNVLARFHTPSSEQMWCSPLEAALCRGDLEMADLLLMAGGNLTTVRAWSGGNGVPKEVAESDSVMSWVHTALEKPLPLMAVARLAIRDTLGFWPQKKITRLRTPAKLTNFLNYKKT